MSVDQYYFLSRVGQVDDNHIYFFQIFITIEVEIEDVSIRYQMENYAKILVGKKSNYVIRFLNVGKKRGFPFFPWALG